jgi:hypothetical protein
MILVLLPTLMFAQPEGDEIKGEFEVIHDYDPNETVSETAIPASILVKTFDAVFNEQEGFVQLHWKLNNTLGAFIIEHSTDGENYNEIGTVNDASGFEADYFIFEAREFDPKVNFYRLKQVIKETIIYSNPLNVSVSPNDDEHFLEFEDIDDKRKVKLRVREKQNVTMKLINSEGVVVKVLLNQELEINEIVFRTIDKGNFIPGEYFLLIEGKSFRQSKKIQLP